MPVPGPDPALTRTVVADVILTKKFKVESVSKPIDLVVTIGLMFTNTSVTCGGFVDTAIPRCTLTLLLIMPVAPRLSRLAARAAVRKRKECICMLDLIINDSIANKGFKDMELQEIIDNSNILDVLINILSDESSMFYYADINDENVVIGVKELTGKIDDPRSIQIPTADYSLIGTLYDNGEFIRIRCYASVVDDVVIEVFKLPETEPQPPDTIEITSQNCDNLYNDTAVFIADALIGTKYVNERFKLPDPQNDRMDEMENKVDDIMGMLTQLMSLLPSSQ